MCWSASTLVDTLNWSAEVRLINPGPDVVVMPPFSCVDSVGQVYAVAVARTLSIRPEATPPGPLPPHLEEIVSGFFLGGGWMVVQR